MITWSKIFRRLSEIFGVLLGTCVGLVSAYVVARERAVNYGGVGPGIEVVVLTLAWIGGFIVTRIKHEGAGTAYLYAGLISFLSGAVLIELVIPILLSILRN